ncbi:MAG TPA: putative toxin-antitoxin system toxin component, PIN family [Candidatus Kapabacteria bacterium]|nr:putative toxin-antitoxin system toxin component, PIN family [Candidatus Kapabacteria bacterium]
MKIILDSNVIIAAFSSKGLCHSLFELCLTKYSIIISDHILFEVYRILHEKFKMPTKKVDEVIDYLKKFCEMQKYEKLKENICRDKDDDEILALAKSASVDYIITGDKDLLVLETFNSIPIVSHWGFWQLVKAEVNNID